jgi:4-carboxymuconolactone decarboxylase
MTDRMPPIPKDQWTDAQAEAAAAFARMRGQDVFGPFALMLRSPEVMLRAAAMGDYMRYKTSLPKPLNEMIILLTARHWSQQFEWYIHQPMALEAGLGDTVVSAISKGQRPEQMSADEAIVYDFATELLRLQNVSDETYARARERFGESGIIDMVGVAGYYSFLSMMMNTARTAVPADSAVPPLS